MKSVTYDDEISKFTRNGFGYSLGDGRKIDFWEQEWIPSIRLKTSFPRVFALASKKQGKVAEFGVLSEGSWEWRIETRRQLFDWEQEQWEQLFRLLNNFQVCQTLSDKLIWKGTVNGGFSVKQFCLDYSNSGQGVSNVWKLFWKRLVPPRVETFCWQVLQGKVAIKLELVKRKLIQRESAMCGLCNAEEESVEHLFFHCSISWKLWMYWSSCWGIYMCVPKDPFLFFLAWLDLLPAGMCKKIWNMLFYVYIWTIWVVRNDVVFNGGLCVLDRIVDSATLKVAFWSKANWPCIPQGLMEIYRCPSLISIPGSANVKRKQVSWVCPPLGSLKFNIDGAASGQPGPAGIGGILRDCNANIKMRFSKSIGIVDSSLAEVLAVKEAFLLFSSS
ncbi:hypothetical protein PTKIN_Ptkin05aG0165200 [Pterospermum kingtungense]